MVTLVDGGLTSELLPNVEKRWNVSVVRKDGETLEVESVRILVYHYENEALREDFSSLMMRKENTFESHWTPKIARTYIVLLAANVQALRSSDVEIIDADDERFYEISGAVFDKQKQVIRDVYVRVNDESRSIIAETQSDEQGHWIVWLRAGKYRLDFSRSGFVEQSLEMLIQKDVEREVILETIAIGEGAGKFKLIGRTIKQSLVKLHAVESLDSTIAQTQANDSGTWSLSVDSGEYAIEFSDRLQQVSVKPDGQIIWGKTLTDRIDAKIAGTGSVTVNGFVEDGNGIGLEKVRVRVYKREGKKGETFVAESTTDANGLWTVKLDPGPYAFEFSGEEFLARLLDASVTGIRPVEDFDNIVQRY